MSQWPGAFDAVPGAVLVSTQSDAQIAVALTAARQLPQVRGGERIAASVARVRTSPGSEAAVAAAMGRIPGVLAAEPDWLADGHRVPNDPWFIRQWPHPQTGAERAWDTTVGSRAVRIAVLDTGVRGDHPDLAANIEQQVDTSTGVLAGPPQRGIDNDTCKKAHGTWVAGVVGAIGDNGRDVAGVNWGVSLIDVAVNSTRPGAQCDAIPFSALIAGMDYSISNPTGRADVINMSVGAYLASCPTSMQSAVNRALAAGTVVVASAGNGETNPDTVGRLSFPASCDGVISVGATSRVETRAVYSTTNARVDLVAPGGDYTIGGIDGMVLTTHYVYEQSTTRTVQGTSFSAPYVAGVAGLLRAVQPSLSPADIRRVLVSTVRDLGAPGRDDEFGHGLVQTSAAVAAVADAPSASPSPSPTVSPSPSPSVSPSPSPSPSPAPTVGPSPSPTASPTPAPPPGEGSAELPTVPPTVQRIAPASGVTTPISQAVAVSRAVYASGSASTAVLAREDDFADALSASALSSGTGPIFFVSPSVPIEDAVRTELRRVVQRGSRVYLVGGTAALSSGVEADVRAMGFEPVRLAGSTREGTAAQTAREVRRRYPVDPPVRPDAVILTTRSNWPDAVTAGQLASGFSVPVLLTHHDRLDAATETALRELRPATVYVAGGTGVVADATAQAAASASGGTVRRLAGPTRDTTAIAIGNETLRLLRQVTSTGPRWAIAVNLRTTRGYAYALSGAVLAGMPSGVFVPVERADGSLLPDASQTFVGTALGCERIVGVLMGGTDVLTDATEQRLETLLREAWDAKRCR